MNPKKLKNYKKFIEDHFYVLDKDSQKPVPFKFTWTDSTGATHDVQEKYYQMLLNEYKNFDGVREIVLKARQEGMSSFILALFAVDFLLDPWSVSICISHRKDSTDLLFRKVKFYIDSYCQHMNIDPKQLLRSDNKNLLENSINNAVFYIGTAGAKVGGRGGSAKNVLFSECAFYQDTELITAQEIVQGTAQQVPLGKGMIFIESTANGLDNYYQKTWEQAERGQSVYKPRFFGWQEMYTQEWIDEKRKEFPNEAMFLQEYPSNPDEAFISTGTPYFDQQILKAMRDANHSPIQKGQFAADGTLDILSIDEPPVRLYRELEYGEQLVVFADPAEAKDFCAAVALSKKHYDCPLVFNEVMESSQFGYTLNAMCKYIFDKTGLWPKLAVERNTGQATIYVLKQLNYPDLFRMVDFSAQTSAEKGAIGWVTTGHMSGGELQGTRRKMLDDEALVLKQGQLIMYDPVQIKQHMAFMLVKGRAQAKSNKKDDFVMATAGAWQVQVLTPSVSWGDYDADERAATREKWRFR